MKPIGIFLLIVSFLIVRPQTNYIDLEKNLFITSIIADINKDDSYSIYYEGFRASAKTTSNIGEGERVVIHAEGTNIADIINEVNSNSSLRVTFAQNRIILFTRRLASKGIDNLLPMFTHYQEFVIGTQIGIWDDEAEKINDIKLKGEHFLGPHLITQLKNTSNTVSNTSMQTIRNLLNESVTGSKISFIPIIKLNGSNSATSVKIDGAGILKDYKLVGTLNTSQIIDVNFLTDKIKSTVITAQNPDIPGKSLALRVLNSKTKTGYDYSDNIFKVNKDVVLQCALDGSENKFNLSNENIRKIQEDASSILKDKWSLLFKEYQETDIDLLNIKKGFYRRYPHESDKNLLENAQLLLNVKVIVESSNDPTDFKD